MFPDTIFLLIYLFFKCKNQNAPFWITVSILSFLGIATYQGYMFLIFPVILGLMIYNLYEKEFDKKIIIGTAATAITTVSSLLYFEYFTKLKVQSLEQLIQIAMSRTNATIDHRLILFAYRGEYFKTPMDTCLYAMKAGLHEMFYIPHLIFVFILFIPLYLTFKYIWKNIFSNCQSATEKNTYKLILSCVLFFIPMFILACDWGRWFFWLLTFNFAILFILYMKNSEPVITAINNFGALVKEKFFLFGIMLLFYMILHVDLYNIVRGFSILNLR